MFRTTLTELVARKGRLVATALAIVLGVGFVAGVLIFGDTARSALFDQFARSARNVDVAVAAPAPAPAGPDRRALVLPASALGAVGQVPGVAAAQGRMREYLPLLDRSGRLVGSEGNAGVALSAGTDPALSPFDVVSGRLPAGSGEAALDADTATRLGFRPGDEITVLDTARLRRRLRLVGTVGFGTSKEYAGRSVVVATPSDITALTGATGYREIVVRADPGAPVGGLVRRVRAAVPAGATVRTGAAWRLDLANNAMNQASAFLTVLLIFAVIACVVAAFVIYNTFTILIAQRIRQMALLRCVGASRRQIFASVLLEASTVGLVGALAGLALGLLVGYGLFSGSSALGNPLPAHPVVLRPAPVLVALGLGLGVSVLSALVPALRATRVAPLRALRTTPMSGTPGRAARLALIVPAVLAGTAGTLLTLAGAGGAGSLPTLAGAHQADPRRAALVVVAGGIVNFLAVLALTPLVIGPLTTAIGWLPGRLIGTPAVLATANVRRNPGRAAATTAALMVGVGLMAAATVAVTTVKVTATDQINSHYPVDFVLSGVNTGQGDAGVPAALAADLRGRTEVGLVGEQRLRDGTVDGARTTIGATDPAALAALPKPQPRTGSWAGLSDGTAVVFGGTPATRSLRVGERIHLVTGYGAADVTVAAVVPGQSQGGDITVTWQRYQRLAPGGTDTRILVRAAPGVGAAVSRRAVEQVAAGYPTVTVASIAEWRAQITGAVNQMIALVAALLAFAIIIALIGIMNTLSLAVLERTRESALVRALGLTRGQLRATLLIEALLMALVGAIVGVGFGVLYGWATARVMFSGIQAIVTVPVGQLLGYVGLAALAGLLAAVLPARKAARASVVAAMAES